MLHTFDYLILLLMVVIAVDIVIAARKKQWWNAGIAAAILAFMIWNWQAIFVVIWRKLFP